jgi:hypothetical protein
VNGEFLMKIAKRLFLVILSLALASLACSTLSGGESANPTTAPPEQAGPTQEEVTAPEPTEGGEASAGDSEVAELDTGTLCDQSSLSSYRAEYLISLDGTSADQPVQGTLNMLLEFTSVPVAQHMTMSFEGLDMGLEGMNSIELYVIEGVTYTSFGDEWMAFPGSTLDEMEDALLFPQDFLDLPPTAHRRLLPETVNGISTWHYVLDENDLPEDDAAGIDSLDADVWVAREGGYLVKMEATLTGAATGTGLEEEFFDEGTVELFFQMSDVNQEFTIELPPEAASASEFPLDGFSTEFEWAREDVPLPADASVDFSTESLVSFVTDLSIEDTAEFMLEGLQANGWTLDGAPLTYEGGYTASFTKGSETLSLTITADFVDPERSNGVVSVN